MGIDTRIKAARLYLITDGRTKTKDFAGFIDAAFGGGVDLLEVRDASLAAVESLAALTGARQVGMKHRQGLVVAYNDLAVAKELGADVMLLGQASELTAAEAKKDLSAWAVVGRSVHTRAQVDAALADDNVGFLLVGPVFNRVAGDNGTQGGLDLVKYAAEKAPIADGKPWFAVGGINAGNLDQVLEAGARRVAVAKALTAAADVAKTAVELSDRLVAAWNADPSLTDRIVIAPDPAIAMAAGLPGEQHLDSVTAPVATADDKAADAAEGEPKPEKQTSAPEAEAGQAPAQDGSAAQHEAEVDQAPAQGERAAQHEHDEPATDHAKAEPSADEPEHNQAAPEA